MHKREQIIKLLKQDIKHNQLLNGLNDLGLTDNERYTLDIVSVVANMMGIPKGKVSDRWLDLYDSNMLNVEPKMTQKEQHSVAINLFESLSNIL